MGDREAEIDGLVGEHREMLSVMTALQRAAEQPDDAPIDELLDQLSAALAHHTDREEAGLFRTLRTVDVPPEYVGLFEHDHGHLLDLLASARRDRAAVEPLVRSLEAHMDREEADMFPAAEQLLSPADWDTVRAAVAGLE